MPDQDPRRRLDRALIFFEDDVARIDRALHAYQKAARAQCSLLVDLEGHVVTHVGSLEGVNVNTISALVAASFAATREVARLLGEEEFTTLNHQSKEECIQLALAGERTILATIYSPRVTTPGLVAFYLGAAIAAIRSVLEAVAARAPRPALGPGFAEDIQGSFDELFG